MPSYVYILECNDGKYYSGMTAYLEIRIDQHHAGIDPTCFTYSRRPLKLVFVREFEHIHDAIAFEKRIKRWSHEKKKALIEGNIKELKRLAQCRNLTHHLRNRLSEDETGFNKR